MEWFFPEANSQKLDYLFSKLLRYENHAENYKLALEKQIIAFGLRIKKLLHLNQFWKILSINGIKFYMIMKSV